MALPEWLTVGELAARSGVATSALRFYESLGLIEAVRTNGNQRRYPRSVLRRVAVIRAAQGVGLSLDEVGAALKALGDGQFTAHDWERVSSAWREGLDARIALLEKLRSDLLACIGCGCLSLERCHLFNRDDSAARGGPGARYLLGDTPEVARDGESLEADRGLPAIATRSEEATIDPLRPSTRSPSVSV